MLTETAVREVLDKIDDPELKKPLTDLDMIRSIDIKGGDITVSVSLTVPGCPMKERISRDITTGVGALSGADSVKVEFDVMTDEQRKKLRERLGFSDTRQANRPAPVTYAKRFIAIASGKGGVGKSTITTNVAVAMARLGHKVGLLDADVYGFSLPHMLGVEGRPTMIDDQIIPLRKGDNIQVISMGLFVNEDEPVVWRGPLLHKAINQFIRDVVWDDLDYLFLDLPPGTGDVSLTIAQAIPSAEMLVVTTPQTTATHVAGRVAKMAEKTNLKVLGVIENMAYFETNGEREYIFGRDGGKKLAKKLGVAFLGEIPLMTSIREGADSGKPIASDGTPDQVKLFESIAQQIDSTTVR
jgi:ATP-binding protein involved in chromosome partitioning